jgi:hypothetical protein
VNQRLLDSCAIVLGTGEAESLMFFVSVRVACGDSIQFSFNVNKKDFHLRYFAAVFAMLDGCQLG